jgi:predicted naringenin-chalcone synthase
MSWRITDEGFAMTLDRRVPAALARNLPQFVSDASPVEPSCYLVHPGGTAILEAVDRGLGLRGGGGLDAAWAVLRDYGNMSSGTVLFVLGEALALGHLPPALLLAFGPGLSVESMMVVGE